MAKTPSWQEVREAAAAVNFNFTRDFNSAVFIRRLPNGQVLVMSDAEDTLSAPETMESPVVAAIYEKTSDPDETLSPSAQIEDWSFPTARTFFAAVGLADKQKLDVVKTLRLVARRHARRFGGLASLYLR